MGVNGYWYEYHVGIEEVFDDGFIFHGVLVVGGGVVDCFLLLQSFLVSASCRCLSVGTVKNCGISAVELIWGGGMLWVMVMLALIMGYG